MSKRERLELLERGEGALALSTQARLLGLNRSGLYYRAEEPSEDELKIKGRIDEVTRGMHCQECGGEMEPRRVEVYGRWGEPGRPVLVAEVPAMVCKQCGQQDLDGPTAQRRGRTVARCAYGYRGAADGTWVCHPLTTRSPAP